MRTTFHEIDPSAPWQDGEVVYTACGMRLIIGGSLRHAIPMPGQTVDCPDCIEKRGTMMKIICEWDIPYHRILGGGLYTEETLIGSGPVLEVRHAYGHNSQQVMRVATEEKVEDRRDLSSVLENRVKAKVIGAGESYPDDWSVVGMIRDSRGGYSTYVIREDNHES